MTATVVTVTLSAMSQPAVKSVLLDSREAIVTTTLMSVTTATIHAVTTPTVPTLWVPSSVRVMSDTPSSTPRSVKVRQSVICLTLYQLPKPFRLL